MVSAEEIESTTKRSFRTCRANAGLATAQYLTWSGKLIEGSGVTPDIGIALDPEALQQGRDTQLENAMQMLKGENSVHDTHSESYYQGGNSRQYANF